MVPKAQLFMITQITAMSSSNAVASAAGFCPKPPSPINATTTLSGIATLAPSAAGEPNPIVANPPGVKTLPGV